MVCLSDLCTNACTSCVLQCVFRVSYLHSHALCSVKLINMSFCCLWGFILFICKKRKEKRVCYRFELNIYSILKLLDLSVTITALKKTDWPTYQTGIKHPGERGSTCIKFKVKRLGVTSRSFKLVWVQTKVQIKHQIRGEQWRYCKLPKFIKLHSLRFGWCSHWQH